MHPGRQFFGHSISSASTSETPSDRLRTRDGAGNPSFAVCGVLLLMVGTVLGNSSESALISPSGLKGEWTFAEGSGSIVGDSSGNEFVGTTVNGPMWTLGRLGTGISFDGSNDHVSLGANLGILQNAPAATIACWVKLKAVPLNGASMELVSFSIGAANPTASSRARIKILGTSSGAVAVAGGRSTDSETLRDVQTSPGFIPVGTWIHIAGVVDYAGKTIQVYVNGALAGSGPAAFTADVASNTPSRSAAFGAEENGSAGFVNGALDEVRVYNRVLSGSEIAVLSSGDALIAHWSFNEGAGLDAGDISGNGFPGVLRNGPSWVGGQLGSAVDLDGASHFIDLGANLNLVRNVNATTVAAWILPTSTAPNGFYTELVSISVGSAGPTNTSRIALALRGDGVSGGDLYAGGRSTDTEIQKAVSADTNLPVGSWSHVAAVLDFAAKRITLYVNGSPVGSAAADFAQTHVPNTASSNAALGAQDRGDSNYFAGLLDDVRIYGRALPPCDVELLALHDGLHAWWRFDEGSGVQAADSTDHSAHGTLANGAGWAPGLFGGAVSLDGTDDYVNLATQLETFRGVRAATAAAWLNLSSVPQAGAFRELFSFSVNNGTTPTNTSRFAFSLVGDASGADLFAGGRSLDTETQQSLTADANLTSGAWVHVAAVVDFGANSIRIYKNGVLVGSKSVAFAQPATPDTPSTNAALGAQDKGDSNYFAGLIDDARVYCRALSLTEIQALATVALPGMPQNLTATPDDTQVKLSWVPGTGSTSTNVYLRLDGGTYPALPLTNLSGSTANVTGLQNGQLYWFKVAGVNAAGEGASSAEVSATPVPAQQVPAAPVLLTSSQITSNPTLTIVGTSSPNITVKLSFNGAQEGSTTSDFQGNWTFTSAPKADGVYAVSAKASNAIGDSAASPTITVTIDTAPPVLSSPQPPPGSLVTTANPVISVAWSDGGSGLVLSTGLIHVDGTDVTGSATLSAGGITYAASALAAGSHNASVQIRDAAGLLGSLSWTFVVGSAVPDQTPPVVTNLAPANGSFIRNQRPTLSAAVQDTGGGGIDPTSLVVVLNGIQVPATLTLANADSGAASYELDANLAEGTQGFTVTVRDLAMNVSTTAGSTFLVDVTLPSLTIVSPAPAPPYSTGSVSLQVSAQDSLAGIAMDSLTVSLNGVDVTAGLTKQPGANNAFGIPSSAQILGSVTGTTGVNSLTVSGADPAGNVRAISSTFSIVIPGGGGGSIVALPISLQIIQSPDPTGLVGRAASKSMKVKVLSGGQPAKGVPVAFTVTEGDGMITYDTSLRTFSDASGMVGARLVLGDLPGPNVVKASVTLDQEVAVTFSVTGQPPTITEVGGFGELSEFPRSAVGQFVTVRAADPAGQPLKGQVVQPFAPGDVATFLPSRTVTDEAGIAKFAVVISPGAAPGSTHELEFRLRDFLDADGNIVALKKPLLVRSDETFRFHMISSGQSQISAPNQTLSQELEVVQGPSPTADRAAVYFFIQEGHGELIPAAGNVQGVFLDFLTGKVVGVLMERVNGRASVRYKAGPQAELALVGLGTSDYFAIGIPEVSITRQRFQRDSSGGLVLDSAGEPIPVQDGQGNPIYDEIDKSTVGTISSADVFDKDNVEQSVSADQKFYIEAKVAKSGSGNAVARLKSLDFCREDLTTNGGFGNVTNEIPFVTTEERDTYSIKRSRAIVASGELPFDGATPSQPVSQLQNGDYFIQSVSLGYLAPKVVFEPGTQDQSEVQGPVEAVFEDIVVLLFDLDGVGRDVWELALSNGLMPNIRTLTGADGPPGGMTYSRGLSFNSFTDFPAITLPAHASLYTGTRISEHKFPGNEWWDRTDQTYFAYGEGAVPRRAKQNLVSALTCGNYWCLAGFSDSLTMEQGGASKYLKKPLLWEDAAKAKLHAVSNYIIFNEGAFRHTYPSVGQLLAIESSLPRPGEVPTDQKATDIATQVDSVITDAALGTVQIRRLIGGGKAVQQTVEITNPNLIGVYYPGPDSATHMAGEAVGLPYMAVVDQNVAKVYSRLTAVQKKKAVLIFVSDHGHLETERDATHMVALYNNIDAQNGGVSEIPEINPQLAAPLIAAGYTDPLNTYVEAMEPGNDPYDHVVTNADGGVVYIYLKNRATQTWGAPRFQEDVLAVAEQIRLAVNQAAAEPENLQGKIDKILVRDGPGSQYQVYLNQGSVVAPAVALPAGDKYYMVAERLSTLSSERTGDIVLLLQTDPVVRANRYYSEQPQKSQHGWMTKKDAENTFVIAGPDIPNFKARLQKVTQKSLRTTPPHISDMYRVVRNLLGF